MTQHTQGPWKWSDNPAFSVNSDNKHVAMVSCYAIKDGDKEENKANARLVAAAPDLLAALETALPYVERVLKDLQIEYRNYPNGMINDSDIEDVELELKQINAAIAKATKE